MKKIQAVTQLYERQDLAHLHSLSNIGPQELRGVVQWSDLVRGSRNTIHFGVQPATPDTYEKVSVLLLSATSNLRILYSVKAAADSSSNTTAQP